MMRTEICMVQLLYRKAEEVSREHLFLWPRMFS